MYTEKNIYNIIFYHPISHNLLAAVHSHYFFQYLQLDMQEFSVIVCNSSFKYVKYHERETSDKFSE